MNYANLHPKQGKTKGFIRAVMLEWEPNSGKHQCGSDEGISCRLEAKGGMLPAVLHIQYQGSAESWRDGLQRRQQIRCWPCSDFQNPQATAAQENTLVQFLAFALQNAPGKAQTCYTACPSFESWKVWMWDSTVVVYIGLTLFIPICCPCVFEATDVIKLSFASILHRPPNNFLAPWQWEAVTSLLKSGHSFTTNVLAQIHNFYRGIK